MMTSSNGNFFCVTDPLCGNSTVTGDFPSQRLVRRSFDIFFDLRLNKGLRTQSRHRWFEMPSHPLWRYCNDHWHINVLLLIAHATRSVLCIVFRYFIEKVSYIVYRNMLIYVFLCVKSTRNTGRNLCFNEISHTKYDKKMVTQPWYWHTWYSWYVTYVKLSLLDVKWRFGRRQ